MLEKKNSFIFLFIFFIKGFFKDVFSILLSLEKDKVLTELNVDLRTIIIHINQWFLHLVITN